MKPAYRTLFAVAFSLSACTAEHWDGGGRRQELPMDERTPEAGSASIATGGTGSATLEPDESSGAGASGEGGAPGAGGSPATAGLGTSGTAPLP